VKIIFIDEDKDQRDTFGELLRLCFPKSDTSIEIITQEPKPSLHEMSYLLQDPDIVTIIIDEQLKESGVAQYFGIELASYLRAANKKLPIYILTSYPESEELIDGEISVEDILNKQELPGKKNVIGARILRRINNYHDIMNEREIKFEQLLRKSISEDMDQSDFDQLAELSFLREAPNQISEIIAREQIINLASIENKLNDILKEIENDKNSLLPQNNSSQKLHKK